MSQQYQPHAIGSSTNSQFMPPWFAGLLRGLVVAVGTAGVHFLVSYFASTPPGALQAYDPIILAGLRTIEGIIDQARLNGANQ